MLRIFFQKTGPAAYISHLDLQRVMARALRRSGLPVWWSKGFNPHIYMSFTLPLPLLHESVAESVDCKTESELEDFSAHIAPLNAALPRGIEASAIVPPVHGADAVASALYRVCYPDAAQLAAAVGTYNSLKQAPVLRKTKRSEQTLDLKELLPTLAAAPGEGGVEVRLPAGNQLHYSPALLTAALEQHCGLPAEAAGVLRRQVFVADGTPFR